MILARMCPDFHSRFFSLNTVLGNSPHGYLLIKQLRYRGRGANGILLRKYGLINVNDFNLSLLFDHRASYFPDNLLASLSENIHLQ